MSDIQPRTPAGVPTGGQFAAKAHTGDSISLDPIVQMRADALTPGATIVASSGNRVVAQNVEPSTLVPGTVAVETEFGTLYLPADEPVTVDTKGGFVTISRNGPHDPGADLTAIDLIFGRGGITGRFFTMGSIDSRLEDAVNGIVEDRFIGDDDEVTDDDIAAIKAYFGADEDEWIEPDADFTDKAWKHVVKDDDWWDLASGPQSQTASDTCDLIVRRALLAAVRDAVAANS